MVSFGTQRTGLMEKNETENSHGTMPLRLHDSDCAFECQDFSDKVKCNKAKKIAKILIMSVAYLSI